MHVPGRTQKSATPDAQGVVSLSAHELVDPPPVSPARGPPTEWTELVQVHADRDVVQDSPEELPVIDIQSL